MIKPIHILPATFLREEKGSALVLVLIILAVVTIIGISSINTTTTELSIAGNDRIYKIAFYAAEAARAYVPANTNLYHENNITIGGYLNFPAADGLDNDGDGTVDETDELFVLGVNNSSFKGSVEYVRVSEPPRGSGYEANKFKAHNYEITSNGIYGPGNAEIVIESGFYRIGF